jgi:signal recognition particle subunit SRP54
MFESLSDRLGGVFDKLRGRGALNESDVRAAMREVRIALLEADVALSVVREFVDKATEQAIGQNVLRSVTPGPAGRQDRQRRAGRDARRGRGRAERRRHPAGGDHDGRPAGLGQDHHHRQDRQAADREEPQEGDDGVARRQSPRGAGTARHARHPDLDVATLPIVQGQQPVDIARRALQAAKLQGYDVLMLDTAGRLHVDQALMDEMKAVASVAEPQKSCSSSTR